jgi:putative transposase
LAQPALASYAPLQLCQPGTFVDPLTDVLRNGARALLTQAVEAEVAALLGCMPMI